MELKLFNSLENKVTLINLKPGQVINIYLCGPTVYDHIHLGNLRPVIIFDVLHRLLLKLDVKVNYVQNITDIDDKIIAKAQKERKSEKEISDHYIKAYFANLTRYNILFPNYSPRVTNYIFQIQKFITYLLAKGTAYQRKDEVFFRIGENQEYGKLSGQQLKKLKGSAREIVQTDKENNRDFVLWKNTHQGINWSSSQLGTGRPGWHTECVVFINELFSGQTIDIHGGGNDLLFPHHENERIQFLANNNKELSEIWLHIAHIHWKEEKMSKSLGNTILAKHFAQRYGTNTLRYLILNSHYNQVINFNDELIQQVSNYVQKIKNLLKKLNFYLYIEKIKIVKEEMRRREEIINSLLNNLNTIKVLYFLEEAISLLHQSIDKKVNNTNLSPIVNDFYFILDILGFKFDSFSYNLPTKLLIRKWQKLRASGNYSQADKIREELQKKNII